MLQVLLILSCSLFTFCFYHSSCHFLSGDLRLVSMSAITAISMYLECNPCAVAAYEPWLQFSIAFILVAWKYKIM